MRLSALQLQQLDSFGRSPNGQFYLEILRAQLAEADADCRRAEAPEVYRAQGAARTISGQIDMITGARTRIDLSEKSASTRGLEPPAQGSRVLHRTPMSTA